MKSDFLTNIVLEQLDPAQILYLYYGPQDNKNRTMCHFLVGKVVPKNILMQLLNKHGSPAIEVVDGEEHQWLGGHGCRHRLVRVTPEIIKKLGLKMASDTDIRNAGQIRQKGFPEVQPTLEPTPQADTDIFGQGLFGRYRSLNPKTPQQRYRSRLPKDEQPRYRYRSRLPR